MLDGTGSSHQDEVLLRVEGLAAGPSLNWDETLLSREWRRVSGRSTRSDVRLAMRWRQSSWESQGITVKRARARDNRLMQAVCLFSLGLVNAPVPRLT